MGQGTRVTFTIPAVEERGGSTAAGRAAGHSAGEGRKQQTSILVVDDDPKALRYVRDALVADGCAPVVTADPRDVADLIRTHKPQLVLLDLVLPKTDGIELMQGIPALKDLPVIFISGYGRDETIARALELGAADYIVKPFSPTELTARIRAALRRKAGAEPFVLGDLAIHYEQRRVSLAGRAVQLTATRFEPLRVLSVNAFGVAVRAERERTTPPAHEFLSAMVLKMPSVGPRTSRQCHVGSVLYRSADVNRWELRTSQRSDPRSATSCRIFPSPTRRARTGTSRR